MDHGVVVRLNDALGVHGDLGEHGALGVHGDLGEHGALGVHGDLGEHGALGVHGAMGVHGATDLGVGVRPLCKLQNVPYLE